MVEKVKSVVLKDTTLVTVGSALSVIVTLVVLAWNQSAWQTKIDLQVERIEADTKELNLKIVGKSASGWHKPDMRGWARELSAANDNIIVPLPKNQFDD